jgi:hypothetical protein
MKLEPIDLLVPASYNPRQVDPDRLDLVKLSIRKLGWLLPVFATEAGELLSGHQRTHVARMLGYTHVPCVRTPNMDADTRKAINILFNRSTNDMDVDSVTMDLKTELLKVNPRQLAESVPDKVDYYPCLEGKMESIAPYLRANEGRWIEYARNVASSLYGHGILMPIVVGPDKRVINGIGRLQLLAEKRIETALFVHVSEEEAALASACLNLLSMDFSIEKFYADLLRYNSFRRSRRVRNELGRGFIFAMGLKGTKDFNPAIPQHAKAWIKRFGASVVDFGAGHLHETNILREMGVRVSPFEPFRLGTNESIDKAESLRVVDAFLADVAAGVPYSSVFISSVLNSVPFMEDRKIIATICAALCGPRTVLYAWASSHNHATLRNQHVKGLASTQVKSCMFTLNYESGIVLGDFQEKPKVQKYHSPQEFYDIFKPSFKTVKVEEIDDCVSAICIGPIIDPVRLRKALEFEFNLPYPDNSTMGRAEQAIAAFEKRLKIPLRSS